MRHARAVASTALPCEGLFPRWRHHTRRSCDCHLQLSTASHEVHNSSMTTAGSTSSACVRQHVPGRRRTAWLIREGHTGKRERSGVVDVGVRIATDHDAREHRTAPCEYSTCTGHEPVRVAHNSSPPHCQQPRSIHLPLEAKDTPCRDAKRHSGIRAIVSPFPYPFMRQAQKQRVQFWMCTCLVGRRVWHCSYRGLASIRGRDRRREILVDAAPHSEGRARARNEICVSYAFIDSDV